MKISYSKVSLSLSANPISLIRGTFFAAAKVFTEFFYKISKLSPRLYRRHYTTSPLAEEVGVPLLERGTDTKSTSPTSVIPGLVPGIL